MRTAIDLDEALLERAKRTAAAERRTLGAVVNDALRAYLAGRRASAKDPPFELLVRGEPAGRFPSPAELTELLEDEEFSALAMPKSSRAAP